MSSANGSWLLVKEALACGQLEECLDRFDEAWQSGVPPRIADLIPSTLDVDGLRLLFELIKIDLEHRWRRCRGSRIQRTGSIATDALGPSPIEKTPSAARSSELAADLPWQACLEDYHIALKNNLAEANWPIDLVVEEYRVRHLWGDRPAAADYLSRFAMLDAAQLESQLHSLNRELARRTSFLTSSSLKGSSSNESRFSSVLDSLQVGDEIDDFRLLNELGAGAFARVFLAQQKSMQRLVALKITERQSFESPVLSQLDHPSIVRVFDERVSGTLTLIYMQYISGGGLRDIVSWRAGKPTSRLSGRGYLDQVAAILCEKGESATQPSGEHSLAHCNWGATVAWIGARLADALHHAHSIGVWHRDIKPENILIASDGRPMLVDFNLSFGQTIAGSTVDDAFGGSLGYMSPEQLQVLLGLAATEAVGAPSDVYSLAIVLWELLTGQHPFLNEGAAADTASLTTMVELRKRGPRLEQLPIDCPRGLREMLQQSLSTDPHRRPDALRLARQCQLSTAKPIDALLHPAEGSWAQRWMRRPLSWLVMLGLIPNACVSALNIWANERLTIHNFDKAFFDQVEKPVVNLIAYTLGVIAAVTIILPIARGLSRAPTLTDSERSSTASVPNHASPDRPAHLQSVAR